MTLDILRKDFIYYCLLTKEKPGLRTLVTAFITYILEWDFRNQHFDFKVGKGTSEPFFLHLFRGCVLFESLLKLNPHQQPVGNSLITRINSLRHLLKIDHIQGKDFVLSDVFDEMERYNKTIFETIRITAIARNTIGHDLGWNISISQDQYRELYLMIATSCLHAMACLWKTPDSEPEVPYTLPDL